MKCPRCPEATLTLSDRQGIEIDYCPQCRGVWLDRGELDKLVERAAPTASAAEPQRMGQADFVDSDYPGGRSYSGGHGGYGKSPKKRSWLNDIFD